METFQQIDIHQVRAMIEADQAVVIDIRDEASYRESHIDGALRISDENIADFLQSSDKNRPVICYCYHGFSSQSAANFLVSQGFKTVYSMVGGFEAWRQDLIK